MDERRAVGPRRWWTLLAWAGVMCVAGWIPLALGWGSLPDPVASHWGISGAPDGRMPLPLVPLIMLGLVVIGLLTTSLFRVEGKPSPEAFAMVGLMGGLGAALNGLLVWLNSGAGTWDEAAAFEAWYVGVVLVGAFGGGMAGSLLGRRVIPERVASKADGPIIEVLPGERVSWVGRASARWPLVLLGAAAVLYMAFPDWGVWPAGLMIVLALAFLQVEVDVRNDGLTVRLGGIPVRRINLVAVSSARAIDLEPAEWGGWGWRLSPNGSAIVLRRGDAIEVTFTGGRRFAVTVDDAATGAALLNGLVARLGAEL